MSRSEQPASIQLAVSNGQWVSTFSGATVDPPGTSVEEGDNLAADPTLPAEKPSQVNPIGREEIDAKLELLLARSDARAREAELLAEARLARFEERMDQAIGEMRRDGSELKTAIGNLKTTTVVTAISAVLAIVFGVAAFNATVLSNMMASFESGKNTAAAVSDATARLERLQDRIDASQAASAKALPPTKK